jgi:acetyl esterase/lipase
MRTKSVFIHALFWMGLVLATAWAWVHSPPPVPEWQRLGLVLEGDVVYRREGSSRRLLDVYRPSQPPTTGGLPAVIAVHGGSWIGGSRLTARTDPKSTFLRLAASGLVVIVVDYQLGRSATPSWPAVMDDLRESVRWVRRHAGELGVDPERIALLGLSSGGHLASLLATLPEVPTEDGVSSRVRAVVSFYAPYDLQALVTERRLDHEPVESLLGRANMPPSVQAREASPINHVSGDDPPMLLFHGTDDLWVIPEQSVRMARALDAAGVRHRLIMVDGARHGFEALVESPERRDLLPEILTFLESAWARPGG